MKQHDEEDTCVPLKEGTCSVWRELELARQERDTTEASSKEIRRVWNVFVQECAKLLGLPDLDKHSEYGGGSVRKGIVCLQENLEGHDRAWAEDRKALLRCEKERVGNDEENAKLRRENSEFGDRLRTMGRAARAAGVHSGGDPDYDICRFFTDGMVAKGEATRLRAMAEKVNEIRNDIIARQSMGWSAHIYPLVAALNEAGFQGAEYKDARVALEATIESARGMAARAWCSKTTEQIVMDPVLAEEFAEMLFPLLQALAFYAREETWSVDCDDWHEKCFRADRGSRARLALGRADRGEVAEEEVETEVEELDEDEGWLKAKVVGSAIAIFNNAGAHGALGDGNILIQDVRALLKFRGGEGGE